MISKESIKKTLQNLGLSSQEASIYLAILSLGPCSAIQISQKVALTRQMVYLILPSLIEKGFIKQVKSGSKRQFCALAPALIQDIATTIQAEVQAIIPTLTAMQAQHEAVPNITVYENPLAMREWYAQYFKKATENDRFCVYSTGQENFWYDLDRRFYDKYLKQSTKIGVSFFIILPDTPQAHAYSKSVRTPMSEYRFRPMAEIPSSEIWIWQDQTCHLTIKENATNFIVLESKPLAQLGIANFLDLWHRLEK